MNDIEKKNDIAKVISMTQFEFQLELDKVRLEQKAIDDKRYEEYLAYMSRELTNDLSFQRKTIIDKACEWITNHNGDDSVIEEFLKYMEE